MAETTDPSDDGKADSSAEWRRRGAVREAARDLAGALEAYDQALKRSPDDIGLLYDLGRLALRMEMPQVAEAFYRRCIEAGPSDPAAMNGLARALGDQHRYDGAVEVLRGALAVDPSQPILWNTLGTLLVRRGDSATALAMFEEAVRLDPGFAQAMYNRSGARMDLGQLADALRDCDAAIALLEADDSEISPADAAMMRFARATLLLCLGRLAEGWAAYAARLSPDFPGRADVVVDAPRLVDGERLSGRSLLVLGEQGLGDEVMFATLLPDLLAALAPGGRLRLAVEPRLVPLFRRSFPNVAVSAHQTTKDIKGVHRRLTSLEPSGELEAWAPLGAFLPRFRSRIADFPKRPAALRPDAARVAYWRAALTAVSPRPKLGVTWRSGLMTGDRRRTYASLRDWRQVFEAPNVQFVNLQYDATPAELAEIEAGAGVKLWRPPGIDLRNDLDDLAALACALDLVIGCANATTNIAAACGAATWIVSGPSWWPMLGTDRLPWYLRARVFTAPSFDNWGPAMAEVAGALGRDFAGGLAIRS